MIRPIHDTNSSRVSFVTTLALFITNWLRDCRSLNMNFLPKHSSEVESEGGLWAKAQGSWHPGRLRRFCPLSKQSLDHPGKLKVRSPLQLTSYFSCTCIATSLYSLVYRLTWLMIPPLLVLINMLEVFIMSKVFVLNKWCNSGEKAQVTRTKSDTWTSCSGLSCTGCESCTSCENRCGKLLFLKS